MVTRNILLIGRTGSGKSTLANVSTNTNEFKENGVSTSVTKSIKKVEFEHKGIKYSVIDTVGIGDTSMEDNEVLFAIVKGCKMFKDGLNQVLFVESGKFTEEEVEAYEKIKKIFLDDIANYTTIVRTNFPGFKNKEKCEKDRKELLEGNTKKVIIDMIKSCGDRIVYVDNPSVDPDDFDDDDMQGMTLNENKRKVSREILLDHLKTCQNVYKPKVLKEIDKEVSDNLIKEGEDLSEELRKIKSELREINEREKKIKNVDLQKGLIEELNNQREKLEKARERIDKLVDINAKLVEKGLFEAIGKGLDKLVDKALDATIVVGQLLNNKCQVS